MSDHPSSIFDAPMLRGDRWWPKWTPTVRLLAARIGASEAMAQAALGWCRIDVGLLHPLWHSETWIPDDVMVERRRYWAGVVKYLEAVALLVDPPYDERRRIWIAAHEEQQ